MQDHERGMRDRQDSSVMKEMGLAGEDSVKLLNVKQFNVWNGTDSNTCVLPLIPAGPVCINGGPVSPGGICSDGTEPLLPNAAHQTSVTSMTSVTSETSAGTGSVSPTADKSGIQSDSGSGGESGEGEPGEGEITEESGKKVESEKTSVEDGEQRETAESPGEEGERKGGWQKDLDLDTSEVDKALASKRPPRKSNLKRTQPTPITTGPTYTSLSSAGDNDEQNYSRKSGRECCTIM